MPKRIIICSDGTWNSPETTDKGELAPSNVVKIAYAIQPATPEGMQQIVYYDRGVGTDWGLDRITGGAFGTGLTRNIKDAYNFLVNNYLPGDELYFFGFSRGSYTVRSIAGLIRNSGILRKENGDRFSDAFDLYRDKNVHPNDDIAVNYRSDFSHDTRIKFIGVWDTVGALGIPVVGLKRFTRRYHEFHDIELSSSVDYAYHAIAIDEKRKSFRPTLWKTKNVPGQVVEQAWFAGTHANVGGTYLDAGLSDLALIWMVSRAKATGLAFNEAYLLDKTKVMPRYDGKLRESRTWLFKLKPAYHRPIGEASNEAIHYLAHRRYTDNIQDYRPKNLVDYLEKLGDDASITQD